MLILLITAPVRCSARVQQLDQQHSLLLRIPDDDDGSSVIENNYSAFFTGGSSGFATLVYLSSQKLDLTQQKNCFSTSDSSTNCIGILPPMVFTSVFPCELWRSRDLHPQHFNRKQLIAINILLSHFNSDYGEADQHGTEPKMGRYWPLALAHTTERALHNRGILGIHSSRPINIQEDIRFCVCHCQSLLFRNRHRANFRP